MIGGTIIKIIEWERQKICDDLLDHVIDYNSSLWFLLLWSTSDEIIAVIGWVCNLTKIVDSSNQMERFWCNFLDMNLMICA